MLNAKVFETAETLPSFEQEVTSPVAHQERILLTTKSPLLDDAGRVADVVTVSLDITELKQAEAQMRHQAGHDALTGLPNRALFRDCLDHALARARRRARAWPRCCCSISTASRGSTTPSGCPAATCCSSRWPSGCMPACARPTRSARLGGDEFAILQTEVRSADEPRTLARRLIDSFGQPFVLNGEEFHTSASIGITLFPADGQAADRLLKNAELAMYRAKSNGRNGSCFFAPQMNLVARRTGLLERELRQAFAADQFTVHYQPQRDLAQRPDRRHRGAAALAPPAARHGPAERVRRAGRGHRPDRAADRAGPRHAPAASTACGSAPACRRCACRSTCRRASSAKARSPR